MQHWLRIAAPLRKGLPFPCGVYITLTDDDGKYGKSTARTAASTAQPMFCSLSVTVNYPKGVTASRAENLIRREYSGDDQCLYSR